MLSEDQSSRLSSIPPEKRRVLLEKIQHSQLSGSALVAEALERCSIEILSGLPGTPIDDIFLETAKRGMRIIGPRNQHASVLIAATQNLLLDKLVHVVCVSAGPAITNSLTGVLHAQRNYCPLLILGGRRAIENPNTGYFQEFDAVPVFQPVTKWAATVERTGDIIPMIQKGCAIASSGKNGPVYLDLPEDILVNSAHASEGEFCCSGDSIQACVDDANKVMKLINSSKRPLVCLGEGLRPGFRQQPVREWIERNNLPFITTSMARGILPDTHPLCFNRIRHKAMLQADVFVLVGAWLDWRFRMGACFAHDVQYIHIHDVPEQLGCNMHKSVVFDADPMDFMVKLSETAEVDSSDSISSWIRLLDELVEASSPPLGECTASSAGYASSIRSMQVLKENLPDDTIVVVDGNIHLTIAQHILEANQPFSLLDPGQMGLIGGGIPMAMGAKCAFPERPVVAVVGDTGFGMAAFELETAVRHQLPIKVMVMNNSGNSGAHRQNALNRNGAKELISQYTAGLKYEEIALALGVGSAAIRSDDQLSRSVKNMINSPGPYCLNIHVDPETGRLPAW